MDTNPRAVPGDNLPPVAEVIAEAYTDTRLALEHGDMLQKAEALKLRAEAFDAEVTSDALNETAAGLVKELRAMCGKVDDTRTATNAPILIAQRTVNAFFKAPHDKLNDLKRGIEKRIGAYALAKAEQERAARLAAAAAEQKRADDAAALAASQETENRQGVADALMEGAVRAEGFARTHERVAAGPIHDLARTRSEAGTTTVRTSWGFVIHDPAALKATLGPLRDCFTVPTIEAALRSFIRQEVAAGRDPALAGVNFQKEYAGAVR